MAAPRPRVAVGLAVLALVAAAVAQPLVTPTPPLPPGRTTPPAGPVNAYGPFTVDSSTETVSYPALQQEGAVLSNQNVPLAYGSTQMNNVAGGEFAPQRTVMFGSQDNYYRE